MPALTSCSGNLITPHRTSAEERGTCFPAVLTVFNKIVKKNRPFDQYGGHIIEYYGMPRGHSFSIYGHFSGKKRTSLYISWEKGVHYYIQTRHNDLFSHCNPIAKKNGPKSVRTYTEWVYQIVFMPPGHPIILLKSNKLNMAAVSVKTSIPPSFVWKQWVASRWEYTLGSRRHNQIKEMHPWY